MSSQDFSSQKIVSIMKQELAEAVERAYAIAYALAKLEGASDAAHVEVTPRSKEPPTLPYDLQKAAIHELPDIAQQFFQDTHFSQRADLLERLVLAINSNDEDVKSRAWISLVALGSVAILPIGEQLLQKSRDHCYRLRLVRLLGELGEKHPLAMGPLVQLAAEQRGCPSF